MTTKKSALATTIKRISPEEARELGEKLVWVDVRTAGEYASCHIEGAELRPLSNFDLDGVCKLVDGGKSCVLVCQSGGRAQRAAERLVAAGVEGVHVLEGGVSAWEESGFAVNRGRGTMSLERQVRIAAGSLVFIGTALGVFFSGWFLFIPGFVGAGLVFAGVTDTCGMGMMLARMPWNQRGS